MSCSQELSSDVMEHPKQASKLKIKQDVTPCVTNKYKMTTGISKWNLNKFKFEQPRLKILNTIESAIKSAGNHWKYNYINV